MIPEEVNDNNTKFDFKKKCNIPTMTCENTRKNDNEENRKPLPKILPEIFNVSVYNHKLKETKLIN